jgi:ADP-ribosylglycohydrolase
MIRTDGYADLDDWAQVMLDRWDVVFGPKSGRFFRSVLNTIHKLKTMGIPRMAALGSIPCSSAAMGIAPVGIVNAGNPARAAQEAYHLSALLNVHDAGLSQDGAAAIAAAVAQAFRPDTDVAAILAAAQAHLLKLSGRPMIEAIDRALRVARETKGYQAFRQTVYEQADQFLQPVKMNALETVPITLALFYLADGDAEKSVTYAINFGRDNDTMAAMGGALAGALNGVTGFKTAWVEKVGRAQIDQAMLAEQLTQVTLEKKAREVAALNQLDRLV